MTHSKLSDHKFKKGKFITPWNEFMSEVGKENSWYHGRQPEYLWLALIIDHYGKKIGLEKCCIIINKLRELAPDFFTPKFSRILELDQETQKELYKYILNIIDVCVLAPLTVIFTYSRFPDFALKFYSPQLSVDKRILKINTIMAEASNHQSHLSTDVRFIVIYCDLLSGKLQMQKEIIGLVLEYPKLSHDDEKMRMIRPTIRSMEMALIESDTYDENYLNVFWEGVSRMSDCELFYVNLEEDAPDTEKYMHHVKTILQYYSDLLVSARPIDNKMLVLLGIATYSYKRILEVVEHELYNTISGRSIVRVLIEDYIMMKYLLQNESSHDDIWSEYQYYGIGQYKLIVERFRESGKVLSDSHVLYDYLDILVGEYKNKDFIDMDTSYFDRQNVRAKAISVGEKELFAFYYDYDSAFEHGLWGAIRESSLIKCNCPAHQYHCIPDLDDKQKLKSVWNDCVAVMNKTLSIIQDVYGLSAHLAIGDERDGERSPKR
ncbi:DUF5677 domain-containing protein [Pelosinus sp. sgz500959]|uniref:DUF5677 domain-containing protein n=1 Tax=Pelosinus sp. sgz500959 TaxID=3242472 RepID=UPI00366D6A72